MQMVLCLGLGLRGIYPLAIKFKAQENRLENQKIKKPGKITRKSENKQTEIKKIVNFSEENHLKIKRKSFKKTKSN